MININTNEKTIGDIVHHAPCTILTYTSTREPYTKRPFTQVHIYPSRLTPDDHTEMLPPTDAYGTEFMTLLILGRKAEGQCVVVAAQDNTAVTVAISETDYSTIQLDAGEWQIVRHSHGVLFCFRVWFVLNHLLDLITCL